MINPLVVNATCHTDACHAADESIPIYNAYNHHYFGWLTGDSTHATCPACRGADSHGAPVRPLG